MNQKKYVAEFMEDFRFATADWTKRERAIAGVVLTTVASLFSESNTYQGFNARDFVLTLFEAAGNLLDEPRTKQNPLD